MISHGCILGGETEETNPEIRRKKCVMHRCVLCPVSFLSSEKWFVIKGGYCLQTAAFHPLDLTSLSERPSFPDLFLHATSAGRSQPYYTSTIIFKRDFSGGCMNSWLENKNIVRAKEKKSSEKNCLSPDETCSHFHVKFEHIKLDKMYVIRT